MKFIDTHAHLDGFGRRGGLAEIVGRARDAGVEKIVACSTNPDEWLFYESAAREFAGSVFWQIGIHPGDISENCEIALDSLGAFFASDFPPVAIGEIGLDALRGPAREVQLAALRAQLRLACERGLPVVLHCVKAFEPLMRELTVCEPRAVIFHGFIGSRQQAAEALKKGYYLSYGIRSFASPRSVEALRATPAERLFLETDDQETPIGEVYARTAELRGESVEALQRCTLANYERIFGEAASDENTI